MGKSNIYANFWLRKICREVNSLLGKFSYQLRLVVSLDILKDERNLTFVHIYFSFKQYIWEHLASGFKHKNFRSREGLCLCLIETLNM